MLANFPKATWGAYREWWQERETRAEATATTDALGRTCEDLCARVKASIGEGDLSRQLESFFSGGTMLRRARDTVATVEVDDELRTDVLAFVEGFVDDASYSRHDDILEHVRIFARERGPFDGVLGFSTGGSVALSLVATAERRTFDALAPFDGAGGAGFAIVLSPYLPRDPAINALWAPDLPKLQTAAVFAASRDDGLVAAADARALRAHFASAAAEGYEADSDRHTPFVVRSRDDPNAAAIRAFLDRQAKRKEDPVAVDARDLDDAVAAERGAAEGGGRREGVPHLVEGHGRRHGAQAAHGAGDDRRAPLARRLGLLPQRHAGAGRRRHGDRGRPGGRLPAGRGFGLPMLPVESERTERACRLQNLGLGTGAARRGCGIRSRRRRRRRPSRS